MFENPVNVIYGEIQTQIEGDVFKAIQSVGIDVDKEELLKALQYDRNQYEKGYADGYAKALDEFAERMKELSECGEISVFGWSRIIDGIAEEIRGAEWLQSEVEG